jgi:endoglucanase
MKERMKFWREFTGLLVIACVTAVVSGACAQTAVTSAQGSTAASRLHHLRHGINASDWFAQVWDPKGYTKEHFESWDTASDIALIKQMGFDNVRLSVNPQPMFLRGRADEIPTDYLEYLDRAVKMMLDQGLAVTIDLHPDSDFKARLANDDAFVEQFADFWRALARHYSTWDPEMVFFEVMNEPEIMDAYRWYGIQVKAATAIRQGAPKHTIIAAGAKWDDSADLVFLEPLRDNNVIYNFHFYDPHVFTHQGATWGTDYWHHEKKLAYPSNYEQAKQVAESVPEEGNRLQVIRYGLDHWNGARVDAEIAVVAEWAKRHHVPVVCNEFGVYRKYSDPQDRARWLSDVRTSLEKYGMGWAMWDYSGGFGVVTKQNGQATPDDVTLRALGLR